MSKEIKTLLRYTLMGEVPTNFECSLSDLEGALRDQIKQLVPNIYEWRMKNPLVFQILSESMDEILPMQVLPVLARFADVKQIANNERFIFKRKLGRQRAKTFVKRGAAAGVYEAFRLDTEDLPIDTFIYTGAARVSFERYLAGVESIVEVYGILLNGFMDKIYELIQDALLATFNAVERPPANRETVNTFDDKAMMRLLSVVGAYGTPSIWCTRQFADEMSNIVPDTNYPNRAAQDLIDIREQGYIGKWHGATVNILPQSYADTQNTKTLINPRVAYIVGSSEKLVQIILEGETQIRETEGEDWAHLIQMYKKMGVGLTADLNAWAMYQNTGIVDPNWPVL